MKIPTAQEHLERLDEEFGTIWTEDEEKICKAFIDFAKLHVEAALKAAVNKATVWVDDDPVPFGGPFRGVHKDSILNAYPLDNIK